MSGVIEFILKLKDLSKGTLDKFDSSVHNTANKFAQDHDKMKRSVHGLGMNIDGLNKKLDELRQTHRLSVDTRQIKEVNREIQSVEQKIKRIEGLGVDDRRGGSMFKSVFAGSLAAGLVTSSLSFAKGAVMDSINMAMENQARLQSFGVLTGSAARGRELTAQLRVLKQSGLGASVYSNAQTMLGFGVSDQSVVKYLKQIGDIAMGDVQRMQSLSLVFAQTQAAGKLTGQDLQQYISAGFNPLGTMAEHWKEFGFKSKQTVGQLKELGEKGKISADMVAKAFEVATSKGGKFYGMMDSIGQTTYGQMQKLKGNWAAFQIDLGNALTPVANDFIQAANDTLHYLHISKSVPETMMAERSEINSLVNSITHLNEGNEERAKMLDLLKAKYPDIFSNLDKEKASNEALLKTLQDVNGEYEKKIKLATYDASLDTINKQIAEIDRLQFAIDQQKHKMPDDTNDYIGAYDRAKLLVQYGVVGLNDANLKAEKERLAGQKKNYQSARQVENFIQQRNAANELLSNPEEMHKRFPKNYDAHVKALQKEAAFANGLDPSAKGNIDYLQVDRLRQAMGFENAANKSNTGGSSSGVNTNGISTKGAAISGGGSRSIVININREMVKVNEIHIKGGTHDSVDELKRIARQAFMEVLESAAAGY